MYKDKSEAQKHDSNMDNKPYKYQYDLDVGSVMVRDTGEHARSPSPV